MCQRLPREPRTGVVIITHRSHQDLRSTVCRRKALASIGLGILGVAASAALAGNVEASEARHHHRRGHRSHPSQANAPAADKNVGYASYYGPGESSRTASGERFDPRALTAAHRTLPLGSHVRVTNLSNGRNVVVRINDRGPFIRSRVIDLSRAAAAELDFISRGITRVSIEQV
jgi:rare lipoprotein A